MVKEIVVWCSPCFEEGNKEVGETYEPFMLPGMKAPMSLDLCEQHHKSLVTHLAQVLEDLGAKTGAAVPTPAAAKVQRTHRNDVGEDPRGPFFCQVPGCTGYQNKEGYRNEKTLGSHLRSQHSINLTVYKEQYDLEGPQPQGDEASWVSITCGIDGCTQTYSQPENKRPHQAMGVHKQAKHGVSSQRVQDATQGALAI